MCFSQFHLIYTENPKIARQNLRFWISWFYRFYIFNLAVHHGLNVILLTTIVLFLLYYIFCVFNIFVVCVCVYIAVMWTRYRLRWTESWKAIKIINKSWNKMKAGTRTFNVHGNGRVERAYVKRQKRK